LLCHKNEHSIDKLFAAAHQKGIPKKYCSGKDKEENLVKVAIRLLKKEKLQKIKFKN
jgi:hypothetical protein